jgi:hypothetical protein
MLVERLELGEVKVGSIIIAESTDHRSDVRNYKPLLCVVLAIGEGYTNDENPTGPKLPMDCKPGNVVILNPMGASFFSVLPGVTTYSGKAVGITSESDVQMRFESVEEFEAYTKAFA